MANTDLATTRDGGKDSEKGTGKDDLKVDFGDYPAKLGTLPHTINTINSVIITWFKNKVEHEHNKGNHKQRHLCNTDSRQRW